MLNIGLRDIFNRIKNRECVILFQNTVALEQSFKNIKVLNVDDKRIE